MRDADIRQHSLHGSVAAAPACCTQAGPVNQQQRGSDVWQIWTMWACQINGLLPRPV